MEVVLAGWKVSFALERAPEITQLTLIDPQQRNEAWREMKRRRYLQQATRDNDLLKAYTLMQL